MNALRVKIGVIIPVFNDDRIYAAVSALLAQKRVPDLILVQDPQNKYGDLQSDVVCVSTYKDSGLFDGIDHCIEKFFFDFDWIFLQGADDILKGETFFEQVEQADHEIDMIYARTKIIYPKYNRWWPSYILVANGYCPPPHFGSAYRRELFSASKMDVRGLENHAKDTLWLHKIRWKKLNILCSKKCMLEMASGGISNGGKFLTGGYKNFRNLIILSKQSDLSRLKILVSYIVATLIKLFYTRRR
jgi:hypothetical protein